MQTIVFDMQKREWRDQSHAFAFYLGQSTYQLNAFTLGQYYGHGIFTTGQISQSHLINSQGHFARLKNDMAIFGIQISEFDMLFNELLSIISTRTVLGISYCCRILINRDIVLISLVENKVLINYKRGALRLKSVEDMRQMPLLKYSDRQFIDNCHKDALVNGFDAALLCYTDKDSHRFVRETSIHHLIQEMNDVYYYSDSAIMGSTIETFKKFCFVHGLQCEKRSFIYDDFVENPAFCVSALSGIRKVESIDNITLPTAKIQIIVELFNQYLLLLK